MIGKGKISHKEASADRSRVSDALFCAVLAARIAGGRIDAAVLARQFGSVTRITRSELLDALRGAGMAAAEVSVRRSTLEQLPLPAILELRDGRYAVLQGVVGDSVRWRLPGESGADTVCLDELMAQVGRRAIAVACAPEDRAGDTPKTRERFGLFWFLGTLFKHRAVMREAMLASVFVQLFALATPIVFMIVIDKVFAHHNLSTLDVLIFALIVVSVFDVVLGGVRSYLLAHTGNRVDIELGRRLFRHLMTLPLSYFESRASGDTIARIRELESVRGFLTGSSLTLVVDTLFVCVFLAVMAMFSPLLAAIVAGSLPFFFLVSLLVTPLMLRRLEDRHQRAAENQSFLVETLGAIETIKSKAVELERRRAFDEKLASYAGAAFGGASLSNWINQLVALLGKALTITLLYVGAKLVIGGSMTVGELIAFNMLSGRVIAPIQRLAQLWRELSSVRISLRRLADIMEAPSEAGPPGTTTTIPTLTGHVRFDNVSFRYDSERPPALADVTFEIEPGELVALVGATGAGKTTLVKLLQRLYTPGAGSITIDGINLQAMDPAWLRRQIGVVSQDFVLFNTSIRENIALGDSSIDDERIVNASRLCGAHDLIAGLPHGYDTILAERGRGLSAGQRQAVALARALVTNPAMLILDEATSAFDYDAERRFRENLASVRAGRTTFVIAHRASTVTGADRVLRLSEGRLIGNMRTARGALNARESGTASYDEAASPMRSGGFCHVTV